MSGELPAGFLTIDGPRPPPDESPATLGNAETKSTTSLWHSPRHLDTGGPEELAARLYGCSGSQGTMRYNEVTKFRDMHAMDWSEARVALNGLVADLAEYHYSRLQAKSRDLVALAEFALTAKDFDFQGKKGDSASKLRKELANATTLYLQSPLGLRLLSCRNNTILTAPPIAKFIDMRMRDKWPGNEALHAMVPMADGSYVRVLESTPDEIFASLQYVRCWLADQNERRSLAADVSARLGIDFVKREQNSEPVTAREFAAAISIVDALKFMSDKLVAIYLGITHSIPLYRLYPATPEREAIDLWWPWGRPMPLVDGGPGKPAPTRKKVLDVSMITAKRPHDVVREVMERTGINRTTAQRLTAAHAGPDIGFGLWDKRGCEKPKLNSVATLQCLLLLTELAVANIVRCIVPCCAHHATGSAFTPWGRSQPAVRSGQTRWSAVPWALAALYLTSETRSPAARCG